METLKNTIIALICCFVPCFTFVVTGHSEEWTVFVTNFDFEHGLVELTDEDGYIWTCLFGEHDWSLGEEYVLVLEDGVNPRIED